MDVHTSFVLFNRIKMLEKPESVKNYLWKPGSFSRKMKEFIYLFHGGPVHMYRNS